MRGSVYGLHVNESVFYIGITFYDLETRLHQHKLESKGYGSNKRKNMHISLNYNLVEIFEIESFDLNRESAFNLELFWIHQFKQWGFLLLNGEFFSNKRGKRNYSSLKRIHIGISKDTHSQMLAFMVSRPYSVRKFVDIAILEKIQKEKNNA